MKKNALRQAHKRDKSRKDRGTVVFKGDLGISMVGMGSTARIVSKRVGQAIRRLADK